MKKAGPLTCSAVAFGTWLAASSHEGTWGLEVLGACVSPHHASDLLQRDAPTLGTALGALQGPKL